MAPRWTTRTSWSPWRALRSTPARHYRVAIVRDLMVGGDTLVPLLDFSLAHPAAVPPETTGLDVKVAILRTFAGHSAGTSGETLGR
jgi:hypothetical protein